MRGGTGALALAALLFCWTTVPANLGDRFGRRGCSTSQSRLRNKRPTGSCNWCHGTWMAKCSHQRTEEEQKDLMLSSQEASDEFFGFRSVLIDRRLNGKRGFPYEQKSTKRSVRHLVTSLSHPICDSVSIHRSCYVIDPLSCMRPLFVKHRLVRHSEFNQRLIHATECRPYDEFERDALAKGTTAQALIKKGKLTVKKVQGQRIVLLPSDRPWILQEEFNNKLDQVEEMGEQEIGRPPPGAELS